jgi:hypothetical protein
MILYHISPRRRRRGIQARGLDPRKATGRHLLVWLVDWQRLPRLIEHIAQHQDVDIDSLDVWEVLVQGNHLHKRRPGVYTSRRRILPGCFLGRENACEHHWRIKR